MAHDYKAITKIFLARPGGHGEPFCGPGMVQLIQFIKDTGNVRKACEDMAMSYSKGWKLLDAIENCLGYAVVSRRQGGKGGGETHLTDEGEVFLRTFLEFEKAAGEAVDGLFQKYFPSV
jgi:molybdate transport system regulatory protein